MTLNRQKAFNVIRVVFGIVWAVDASFKWMPAFLNGLPDMISSSIPGQPALIADWLGFWLSIINTAPHLFAVLIALIESALAIGLILNVFPRIVYIAGFIFSLGLWSVGESFGGPYAAGSTDVGTAIIYAFVFAALYFDRFASASALSSANTVEKSRPSLEIAVKALSIAVLILLALLVSPYFVTRTSTAQQTDMPPGMVMKTFYIGPLQAVATDTEAMSSEEMSANMAGMNMNAATTTAVPDGILASTTAPIPTVSFIIVKDTLDGWDLHITTTNFTFTPQNINQAPIADQGHAHLYIDGNLTVLLGPWYHIDGSVLPPGRHTITVSLNANDHSVFSANGVNVQETQTLIVSPI